MVGTIKCFTMLEYLKIMLMEHQKDIPEIWKSKRTQKVKHGEKDLILKQLMLKLKELLMLELLNIKLILLLIEQLTMRMDIMNQLLI